VVKANLCMKAILLAMSLVIVFFVVLCTTILEVLFARLGFVMRRKGMGEAVLTQVEVYARQAQHDTAAVRNLQRAVQCCHPSPPRSRPPAITLRHSPAVQGHHAAITRVLEKQHRYREQVCGTLLRFGHARLAMHHIPAV
jgi:hypothetical protein